MHRNNVNICDDEKLKVHPTTIMSKCRCEKWHLFHTCVLDYICLVQLNQCVLWIAIDAYASVTYDYYIPPYHHNYIK